MSPLTALLATLLMSLIPGLLFLELWNGLRRMQESPLVELSSALSDIAVREVTLRDAVRGVMGLQDDYTERPSSGEYRF